MRRMTIKTRGKQDLIEGEPWEIVEAMGDKHFVVYANKFDYMENCARRVKIMTNMVISHEDPRTFLYGLQRAGLIKVLSDIAIESIE